MPVPAAAARGGIRVDSCADTWRDLSTRAPAPEGVPAVSRGGCRAGAIEGLRQFREAVMDEQGGAGGVPRRVQGTAQRDEGRTAAADTDEASRLDRPVPRRGHVAGRRRWTSPKGDEEQRGESDE